jgi:WD40 repeat protein
MGWNPTGSRLTCLEFDCVTTWDLPSGKRQTFGPFKDLPPDSLAGLAVWNRSGRYLAFSLFSPTSSRVWIWDAVAGALRKLPPASASLYGWEWSPDGTRLAVAGPSGVVLEKVGGGETTLHFKQPVTTVSWSRDDRFLAAGFQNGTTLVLAAKGTER